jgi:transcriptional regulator with XRE-family HTH domain
MNARQFLELRGREVAEKVARKAGTSYAYLYQISLGHRRPSLALAKRLVAASGGEMDLVSLLTFERPAAGYQVSA